MNTCRTARPRLDEHHRWTEAQLAARAKSDAEKATLAVRLRRETPMTRAWIAQRLSMGSASYVSHLTNGNRPDDRH